jgi:polyisoprenoid-binding protein YceI
MKTWTFEPGHTAVEFCVRHMMVTYVRGHFKNVRGTLAFDPDDLGAGRVDVVIDARALWSGEPDRDAHLTSADFLDVERYPTITFRSTGIKVIGPTSVNIDGLVTIRDVTRPLALAVDFLGTWQTPWWEGGVDRGPRTRAGFVGTGRLNRHDFGVSWNAPLDRGGMVVGDDVLLTLDGEAVLDP